MRAALFRDKNLPGDTCDDDEDDDEVSPSSHNVTSSSLSAMPGQVLTFVVVVIVLAVGGLVVAGVRDTLTTDIVEYNVSSDTLDGIERFSNFLPTIAVVMISAVVIAVVVSAFVMFRGR